MVRVQQVSASRRIAAPATVVWGLVTDVAGTVELLSAVTSVEVLTAPGPLALGTRWRETRTMFGRTATEEMAVIALVPGEFYTVASDSHGARYTSTVSVRPEGPGACTVTLTFGGQPTGRLGRFGAATLGRLLAPANRRVLSRDLADIAAAAERRV
jgi:carbon monoxide dehydrogenase subunit G